MKKILFLFWIMLAILPAATAAVSPPFASPAPYGIIQKKPVSKKSVAIAHYLKKHPGLQQMALKLTQKKWFQKWMAKVDDRQRTKDIMGLIALISGALLILSLFVLPVAAVVLVPAAVVCGIIGVSKNYNRRSYTFALIGLVLGGLYLVLLALLLVIALAWVNNW